MKLSVSPYQLIPKVKYINSKQVSKVKNGSLVKVEFSGGRIGYGDYHKNEEFVKMGLFDLKKYFLNVADDRWNQTLKMAEFMSSYDKNFELKKVKNHILFQDIINTNPLDILKYESQGVNKFKVKMGRSLRAETNSLIKIIKKSDVKTKFRLDFNCSIQKKEFIIWLEKNSAILKKIEFIEDPFSFDATMWRHIQGQYKVNLALDFAHDPLLLSADEIPNIIILKPGMKSCQEVIEKFSSQEVSFVMTHFMDHPLGQLGVNFIAQRYKNKLGDKLLDCGAMGFSLFESNDFHLDKFCNEQQIESKIFNKKYWGLTNKLEGLNWLAIN